MTDPLFDDMITSFSGDYRFLSNFWPAQVYFDEIHFPSVEHAYVASKTIDLKLRHEIAKVEKPGAVKRLGKTIKLRKDWDFVKLMYMKDFVRQKFLDTGLLMMLLETGDRELIEGNTWGDTYWGQSPVGVGENNLGKILMGIRGNWNERF
jgi:ribA/ribD-fused uncharacterized protein